MRRSHQLKAKCQILRELDAALARRAAPLPAAVTEEARHGA